MPDAEALASFRIDDNSAVPALAAEFWQKIDLSKERAETITESHLQHDAVMRLAKDYLAQKLQEFHILYFITFFSVLFLGAFLYRYLPPLRQPEKFKMIIASNGIYFLFLSMLSLIYGLKQRVKWYLALGTFSLLMLSPFIYERFVLPATLKAVIGIALVLSVIFLIYFFKVTRTGKQLAADALRLRHRNHLENLKRDEFVSRVMEFFLSEVKTHNTFHRRLLLKSALRAAYPVLACEECQDKKAALQEFRELGKFKDSMGKLGTVVFTAAALAYLFIFSIPELQAIPVAVASVIPIYTLSILIMSEIDKARDKALDDVIKVINSRVETV
jgi:ABC-type multidrug transport system fused ATPase/permease subunit